MHTEKTETKKRKISDALLKRENTILSILLTGNPNYYSIIKQNLNQDDFKDEINNKIAQKLYEEFEKGNSNINSILNNLTEEEQNRITEIIAIDYEIQDIEKAIDDLMQGYQKDKLTDRKYEILELLEETKEPEEKKKLEKELNDIIISLAKIK